MLLPAQRLQHGNNMCSNSPPIFLRRSKRQAQLERFVQRISEILSTAHCSGACECANTCAMQGHVRTISDIDVEQGKMMDHQASYIPREKKMLCLRIGDR